MKEINYLSEQLITYIGNKRQLLTFINAEILAIKKSLGLEKIACMDLFSGSGVVARLLKQHAYKLYANDLELYSYILNDCFLHNIDDFNQDKYNEYKQMLEDNLSDGLIEGIISKNYAPKDSRKIELGERAFYTRENALRIDTIRFYIDEIEESYRKFFLAPLLCEASIHVNTAGVFKGFYKDPATKIGKFGGAGENALQRIMGRIELKKPILSCFNCEHFVYQSDANQLVRKLPHMDLVYIDPPYNQHPYGSNYFMLNLIAENSMPEEISSVSGIPESWNRSDYNKKAKALKSFEDLIQNLDAKYAIISYNSEGFISFNEMKSLLQKYGKVKIKTINYNAYKGARNLHNRNLYVSEYLFVLQKEKI